MQRNSDAEEKKKHRKKLSSGSHALAIDAKLVGAVATGSTRSGCQPLDNHAARKQPSLSTSNNNKSDRSISSLVSRHRSESSRSTASKAEVATGLEPPVQQRIAISERTATRTFHRRQSVSERPLESSRNVEASQQTTIAAGSRSNSDSTSLSSIELILLRDEQATKPRKSSTHWHDDLDDECDSAQVEQLSEGFFEICLLNLSYSVGPNLFENPKWGRINSLYHKEQRTIVKSVSGSLTSGQMVALMGPSGAGKTCLLECIAGVRNSGIGGSMWIRGRCKAQLAIVPQYDNFMRQFSVEEIIIYGSRMKNEPTANHKEIADNVIQQLGLSACRTNRIDACSGGQRKRVAIAQELVSKPNVLILDEPTSGLDSSCCFQTMQVLREVINASISSSQPMVVIMTIHQPSAKVFELFDLVFLLTKTGRPAYTGPPNMLLPTIRSVTGLECPKYSNPSDYMIEIVAYDYGEIVVDKLVENEISKARKFVADYEDCAMVSQRLFQDNSETNSNNFIKTEQDNSSANLNGLRKFLRSTLANSSGSRLKQSQSESVLVMQTIQTRKERSSFSNLSETNRLQELKTYLSKFDPLPLRQVTSGMNARHPFFWHIWVHMHRSFLQSVRDPVLNNMRILIHFFFALIVVLMYGKLSGEAKGCPPIIGLPFEITDPKNENAIDLADNIGYLFMCIMMITYVSLMTTVLTFPMDIKTVGKEFKNGWYGTLSYFLGKTMAEVPFVVMYPVIYTLIVWYSTHQAQDALWRYVSFTGLIILNALNSQTLGLVLGTLFMNSVTSATFLGPVLTIPWYLFTGFAIRVHRLNEPYKTISGFLFTRSLFEGLLDTVYGHGRCNCTGFLEQYNKLRHQEAVRLAGIVSEETLSSLDYYDSLETITDATSMTKLVSSPYEPSLLKKTFEVASTVFANEELNFETLLEQTSNKASSLFSFGLDFEPICPSDYKSFVIQNFRLEKDALLNAFIKASSILLLSRILTYMLVAWKIRTRH